MNGISEIRRTTQATIVLITATAFALGCRGDGATSPARRGIQAGPIGSADALQPNFNLQMILRPPGATNAGDAFGHVEFRQNNDDALIFDLEVWVRGLQPNTHYRFQRAVETVVNDDCTSTAWLTIGLGTVAQDIVTDERGTATQVLFRASTVPRGTAFDLHTRVVTATTVPTVVLESECYQFFVR
jgi:hypothetical protein